MSTRCAIIIANSFESFCDDLSSAVLIGHIHDGYPSGVGSDLLKFFKDNGKSYFSLYTSPVSFAKHLLDGLRDYCKRGLLEFDNNLSNFEYDYVTFADFHPLFMDYIYFVDLSERVFACFDGSMLFNFDFSSLDRSFSKPPDYSALSSDVSFDSLLVDAEFVKYY